jgi:HAD superfamily hydrolase (TIGR01450 family)
MLDRIEAVGNGRIGHMRASLTASRGTLATSFDVALLDLDGVVYVGRDAVPGAPQALADARDAGMRLAFVTNNAARTPESVAEHLTALGIPADAAEVTTSSQAAAHYLADRLPAAAPVLVVGTTGLVTALRERGLTPVFSADDAPQAVVQGYSPELDWQQLAEGAVAIRAGVPWIATNLDPTVPSPRGPLPGNGSMVAALRHATGVTPTSTGKPDPTMHRESVQRSQAQSPIVVGDRLDTDIEGAAAVGCPSLLVLTGVTDAADLLAAGPRHRPDFLSASVAGLLVEHPRVEISGAVARCGDWQATVNAGRLTLSTAAGKGAPASGDDLDALRALCSAAWTAAGDTDAAEWQVRADSDAAQQHLAELRLG